MEIEFDGIGNELELSNISSIIDMEFWELELDLQPPSGGGAVARAYAP